MPRKEKKTVEKRKDGGHFEHEKDDQRSPSPPLLKKRKRIEQPKSDNDQSAQAQDSQMPLVQHLDDLALDEVKRQLKTFSLLQLATVNRRFSDILADQGKDVHVRLDLMKNDYYGVNFWDGSGAKFHRKIDHNKLTIFLKNIFKRLKQLREIATNYRLPNLGYCSLLRALMFHQVKVYRLHLRDESIAHIKTKWELLGYCAPNLHTLGLWQSGGAEPACSTSVCPWEGDEAKFAADKIAGFEKCANLRRFRLVGWLTPTTIECIGQLKQMRRLDVNIYAPSNAAVGPLVNILATNDKLRHLLVNYDWANFLANSHAATKLFGRLKTFGFKIKPDRSPEHFTAVTLPPMRSQLLDILTMMGLDGQVDIGLSFRELFRRDCSRENSETIVKNFIAFWLDLSISTGGSMIILNINYTKWLIDHLVVSEDQLTIQLKPTYPTEWKMEQDPEDNSRYTIRCPGGSVGWH